MNTSEEDDIVIPSTISMVNWSEDQSKQIIPCPTEYVMNKYFFP